MRTIIAGTRNLNQKDFDAGMKECPAWVISETSTVLSGNTHGIDTYGKKWATQNGKAVATYPADWATHGKAAGPIRNDLMVKNAHALILIWDGKSKGSFDVLTKAIKHKLTIYNFIVGRGVVELPPEPEIPDEK